MNFIKVFSNEKNNLIGFNGFSASTRNSTIINITKLISFRYCNNNIYPIIILNQT